MGLIFVFGGSINQLINGLGITEWIFYGLVFIACIILRFTNKTSKRPFKVSPRFEVSSIIISPLLPISPPLLLSPSSLPFSYLPLISLLPISLSLSLSLSLCLGLDSCSNINDHCFIVPYNSTNYSSP